MEPERPRAAAEAAVARGRRQDAVAVLVHAVPVAAGHRVVDAVADVGRVARVVEPRAGHQPRRPEVELLVGEHADGALVGVARERFLAAGAVAAQLARDARRGP
jgi:hypothetical protein